MKRNNVCASSMEDLKHHQTNHIQEYWTPGRIGILGGGSWATALAKILLDSGQDISWYFRFGETVRQFQQKGHNPTYLTSVTFDLRRISFYTDLHKIVAECDTLLLVTPSPYLKALLSNLKSKELKGKFILNAVKGIIPDKYRLISDYLEQEFTLPKESIGVISGPTHAEEVAMNRMSYLTLGCPDLSKAERLRKCFSTDYVCTKISPDINGIEYAGVLKNIYAIASGICQGLKMGDNFQAVLISSAATEMDRFTKALSSTRRPITESVYLGDLLVTGYSKFSRNRSFGSYLGRGYSVRQAQHEMEMIAEGYYGAKCIHEVNRAFKVYMPIAEMVYQILYHRLDPAKAIDELKQLIH